MLRLRLLRFVTVHKAHKPPTAYDLEIAEWRKNLKATIRQYRQEFWEMQEEVENKWIDEHNAKLLEQHKQKLIKRRDSIIKISRHTQDILDLKKTKADERAQRMEVYEGNKNKLKRAQDYMIEIMNLDSKHWPTADKLDQNLTERLIVPHSPGMQEYYIMQNEGYSMGSPAEDFNNRSATRLRNQMLMPLYSKIKGVIKRLTHTPSHNLELDYIAAKSQLDNPDKIKKLQQAYLAMHQAIVGQDSDPEKYLIKIHNQMFLLHDLLSHWSKYVEILYLHDAHIETNYELMKEVEESPAAFAEQADDAQESWEKGLVNANPETSDYFDEAVDRTQFYKNLEEKEAEEISLDFSDIFQESSKDVGYGLDGEMDLYGDIGASPLGDDPSKDIQTTLDNLLSDVSDQFSTSKQFFENYPSLRDDQAPNLTPSGVFSPSITLTILSNRISSLADNNLTKAGQWRKGEVLSLIDKIQQHKLKDPGLLYKVYQHHRYEPVKFSLH